MKLFIVNVINLFRLGMGAYANRRNNDLINLLSYRYYAMNL